MGVGEKQSGPMNNSIVSREHPSVRKLAFSIAGKSNVSKRQLLNTNPELPTK
jgi:hypothetical protein